MSHVEWLIVSASPLWLGVLLAVTSVAGTVAVLLIVELAHEIR